MITNVEGIVKRTCKEILLSPTAREIIAKINAMPTGFTIEMERAAEIREHRKILSKACTIH